MPQQFTNRAQLSYNNTVVLSNTVTGEIADVLSISKTVLEDSYTVGGRLTYVVNLVNSDTVPLTDLTLVDDLGAGTGGTPLLTYVDGSVHYFADGVEQPAPTATGGTTLTITGISVPAGGNAAVIYETTVNEYASPEVGAVLTNTVTASGDGTTTVTASATVPANVGPVLTISKTLSPLVVTASGVITYTFLIRNNGNEAAGADDNLNLTDTFNPILSGITVTYNGAPMAASGYTYDEGTGVFQTTAGSIEVPAGTFTQNEDGTWTSTPGEATLTITGTI
ncbi:MAG: hypothetical protein E7680_00020 [Ruminococcaceae bacterium]|nr:hypothetical protein [Oscillospiraceae bacterium]